MAKWIEGSELDKKVFDILNTRTKKTWFVIVPFSQDIEAAFAAIDYLRAYWGVVIKTIDPIVQTDTRRWTVEMFTGEPAISNGVGEVSDYREYHGWGSSLPLAICRAIVAMDEGESIRV